MLSRWPIRSKIQLGIAILSLIVILLTIVGFRGVYSYRELARTISQRASELPKSAELMQRVEALRFSISRTSSARQFPHYMDYDVIVREEFRSHLGWVAVALRDYKEQLEDQDEHELHIGDLRDERQTVARIEETLARIYAIDRDDDWNLRQHAQLDRLEPELDKLHALTSELPTYLHRRMQSLQADVRLEYRTWIVLTWLSSLSAMALLAVLVMYFNRWIFRPLQILIEGSRRVAADQFEYRIELSTHDEMAELAGAMNAMTDRFRQIRDDLNWQVKQRTKEVVRSEQLASVGFLAAGVAHEINNPLASIAWSAEALESRLEEILAGDELSDKDRMAEAEVLRKYLRRIQDEAFRCKGITEGLLDFSRMGNVERQPTDLRELIVGVVEMVQHLGKYREKRIEFEGTQPVAASVNPQEMKQVVLNLVTNALDSVDLGGRVVVRLSQRDGCAELEVEDDGCGMTEEVKEHMFEPFFTRRRDGSGTGLGLSITYRIVQDHGGTIEAESDGPGCGSRFRVSLPLVRHETKLERRYQVA